MVRRIKLPHEIALDSLLGARPGGVGRLGRKNPRFAMDRRTVLRGFGGVAMALPFLEGLAPRKASAQDSGVLPYAIFFRQGNGVATEQESDFGSEPERFWPHDLGACTADNLTGRALDELTDFADRMLVVGNVNMRNFDYGDGHARGALQLLTARDPVVPEVGGDSEASGESVDHRIGRQMNAEGRDSLFLYAGSPGGWLGGPCISYRGDNNRRTALHNPWNAYETLFGDGDLSDAAAQQLLTRNRSVNDLVRGQLQGLLNGPQLSQRDRERLELHLDSVRDTELSLQCMLTTSEQMTLQGLDAIYESNDGNDIWQVVRAHMNIAALAVACGYTRSVAIQVGNGNDGSSQYRDPDTGEIMENFHYISHRRFSHDNSGGIIANSDLLHHKVDRQFAQAFRYLLERLDSYDYGGTTLLDLGVSAWMNDLGNGPGHSPINCPVILAGSAGGFFKQGEHINIDPDDTGWEGAQNHARVLNTIATAVGCTSEGKDFCDDIGEDDSDRSPHPDLMA